MLKDLCFKHCGFAPKNEELLNPLHDVGIPVDLTRDAFEEMVDQDVDAPVIGEFTDEEILEATQQLKNVAVGEESYDEEEVEPPLVDILESLNKIRTLSQKGGLFNQVLSSLKTIETLILKKDKLHISN